MILTIIKIAPTKVKSVFLLIALYIYFKFQVLKWSIGVGRDSINSSNFMHTAIGGPWPLTLTPDYRVIEELICMLTLHT